MAGRISYIDSLTALTRKLWYGLCVEAGALTRPIFMTAGRRYKFTSAPDVLALHPKTASQDILKGHFYFDGRAIDVGPEAHPWAMPLPSEDFAAYLHRFDWLAPLMSSRTQAEASRAQYLLDSWIEVYGNWNRFAWQPDILTNRIFAILSTWQLAFNDNERSTKARRLSLARQISRLKTTYNRLPSGYIRLKAAATLVLAGAMTDHSDMMDKFFDELDDELDEQILPDGGHISRNPQTGADILHVLLTLESTLIAKGVDGSKQTRRAIDRLAPALQFFSLTDNSLTCANGSGELNAKALKLLSKKSGVNAKPFSYMPHTGYQRLDQNGTVVIMDLGESPPRPYDLGAHLAPLALELSSGLDRLIINCGWSKSQPAKWRDYMRETAAHSTLVLDNCSAGRLLKNGFRERLHGPAINRSAGPARASRKEHEGGVWLEASHESYLQQTGLNHRRRLFLDREGLDLRGEDSLYVPMGKTPKHHRAVFDYAIRFHVHPDVKVTLSRDRNSAILIPKSGQGWRFRCNHGPIKLEQSIYLARGHRPEKTQQIVVQGQALSDNDGSDVANCIKWSFKKIGPSSE